MQFPNDSWRLTLPRKLDKVAQKEFEAGIPQIQSGGYTTLALDLNLVVLISNSGLGQIAMIFLDLKAKGIEVNFVGISPKIQGMLDRLDSRIFLPRQNSRRSFPTSNWQLTHLDQWNFHWFTDPKNALLAKLVYAANTRVVRISSSHQTGIRFRTSQQRRVRILNEVTKENTHSPS